MIRIEIREDGKLVDVFEYNDRGVPATLHALALLSELVAGSTEMVAIINTFPQKEEKHD